MTLIDEPGFRKAFERALVSSERVRSLAFAVVLACLSLVATAAWARGGLAPALYARVHGLQVYHWTMVLTGSGVLYELLVWRLLRDREVVPKAFSYVTTLVEMLIPAGMVWVFAQVVDATHAIGAPPILAFALLIVVAALHVDEAVCVFAGVVAAGYYYVLHRMLIVPYDGVESGTFLTEPGPHVMRGAFFVLIGVGAAFVTWQIKRRLLDSFEVEAERQRVFSLLGEQVSPEVAEALVREGGAGRVQDVSVVFLDIRGFTTLAEGKSPEATVEFLNDLFEPMIRTISRHRGIINKFLGDGFMAVFGPPFTDGNPSQAAVAACQEILDELGGAVSRASGVRVGIGIHSGRAVTGNIGSDLRKEYTVIGDVVNVASRIEQLNKEYEAQLLVSAAVFEDLDPAPEPKQKIDDVRVKGREEPLTVYQLA